MRPTSSYVIDFVVTVILIAVQICAQVTLWRYLRGRLWGWARLLAVAVFLAALDLYLFIGLAIPSSLLRNPIPVPLRYYRLFLIPSNLILFGTVGSYLVFLAWRKIARKILPPAAPEGNPEDAGRRRAIQAIGYAAVAAPTATIMLGAAIGRTDFQVHEVEIPVANLHPDLQGLRIVQLSDLHLGAYLTEKELARAIDAANNLRGHFGLVTGDLITDGGDPLEAAVRQIARLKTDAGVFGCMGNHEYYAGAELLTQQLAARRGIQFLRTQNLVLRVGQAQFNLAGVDHQSSRRKDLYLQNADDLIVEGIPNFLLSHNPDVFPVAVEKGFDVTFSGHTHGGQITMEIFDQTMNFARFYTRYVSGLYSDGNKSIYVTRGIGTIGVPSRVGALPEITLIKLKRA